MQLNKIIEYLKSELNSLSQVMFGYIYGSVLSSKNPEDIDIAVYLSPMDFEKLCLDGELSLSFAIPLEMKLEEKLKRKVDIQVMNHAPLSFRYRVITDGKAIVDKDSNFRCDFEYLSRVEYYDFRPRRKEYLQEVMS